MICDVYDTSSGEPFEGDPRRVLKNAIERAEEMGYEVNFAPEPEFFLFEEDEDGNATTETADHGGYFDVAPKDLASDVRRDIIDGLESMGFEIEASHHEVAKGQHEINFEYDDALSTADNVATFRMVVRAIAAQHDLHATFMPKPIPKINGSGMHTHMSLMTEDGENAFHDDDDEFNLSETAHSYLAGVLEHAPAITAVANPTVNSYKRLVPGYEAPVYVAWSDRNRSALIRKPALACLLQAVSNCARRTHRVTHTSRSLPCCKPVSTASSRASSVRIRSARTSTSSTTQSELTTASRRSHRTSAKRRRTRGRRGHLRRSRRARRTEVRRSQEPRVRRVPHRRLRLGTRPVPRDVLTLVRGQNVPSAHAVCHSRGCVPRFLLLLLSTHRTDSCRCRPWNVYSPRRIIFQ